jgi:hypothetical protein
MRRGPKNPLVRSRLSLSSLYLSRCVLARYTQEGEGPPSDWKFAQPD